jgi:hypothetical protein
LPVALLGILNIFGKKANIKIEISGQISAFVTCISIMTNGAVIINSVRFEAFTAVTMKNVVFWDVAL